MGLVSTQSPEIQVISPVSPTAVCAAVISALSQSATEVCCFFFPRRHKLAPDNGLAPAPRAGG